ncbi:hypothetical protein [Photobacterium leiognathi]|uniref:hypothetical protein n=1 Tax=Photobacterium leiognathi TaxID=553611 RepID=UPI00273819E6|nr:hypothetical protein [Photobacterium leiognathi]
MKSPLTDKPTLSYTVQVSPTTYLKVYLKPFRFNAIEDIGYGYITLLGVVDIGENNNLLRNSLLSNQDEYQFTLDDVELYATINPTLAIKDFFQNGISISYNFSFSARHVLTLFHHILRKYGLFTALEKI